MHTANLPLARLDLVRRLVPLLSFLLSRKLISVPFQSCNFSYTHLSQLSESAHLIGKCSIILSLNSFRYPQVRCLTVCGCLSNLTIMDLEVTSLVEQIEDQGNWYILTGFHFVTEKAPFEVARSFRLC